MKASTKKIILISLLSLIGALLLAGLTAYIYFNIQFKLYVDQKYNFAIRYPSQWKVLVHPKPQVAVIFVKPKDTALDTINESLNVTVQPLPSDVYSLPAFTAKLKGQMIAIFDKNITFVEDKPMQWGWHEGHLIDFLAPKPDHVRMINAWTLYHNNAYILTFLGDMNKYPQDAPFVQEMIRSLKFNDG